MQMLSNLRIVAELMLDNIQDIGSILDNTNKKAILELEKIYKARKRKRDAEIKAEIKAEKKRLRDEAIRIRQEGINARRMRRNARMESRFFVRVGDEILLAMKRSKQESLREMVETLPQTENECPVCYETKSCVSIYKCAHLFCKDCLINWANICPTCRSL